VFHLPPAEQCFPILLGVAVGCHPPLLRVPGTRVGAIKCRAHKALAIVGGRIEKMADNLLARPAAGAPGDVRKAGWQPEELRLKDA
jgi:hypothetical protein